MHAASRTRPDRAATAARVYDVPPDGLGGPRFRNQSSYGITEGASVIPSLGDVEINAYHYHHQSNPDAAAATAAEPTVERARSREGLIDVSSAQGHLPRASWDLPSAEKDLGSLGDSTNPVISPTPPSVSSKLRQ